MKHKILLHPLGKELTALDQTPLIDVLHGYGIEFPCGGRGSCGKCKVRLISGEIETTTEHMKKLQNLNLWPEWRLACYSLCTGDITLEVDQFEHIILADESEFDFVPREGFGIAVDIGTSTLVAQLVSLSSGRVMAAETMLNPQVKFGADLISRISACLEGHTAAMSHMIRDAIGKMVVKLLQVHSVEVARVALVGNTAMKLIFANRDVSPLSAYPFATDNMEADIYTPRELGWHTLPGAQVEFWPSIGSFVGSDILAGIVAISLHKKEEVTALIDLGTNGEIVVGNKHAIVCASTAAGPAFEGANISVGMRAVTGAVSSLALNGGNIEATVIGRTTPKGICGSALIDAMAILRQLNLIGTFGEINSGEGQVTLTREISLTQKDINEFQLAKAAVAAGLTLLARELHFDVADIHTIYIAGGFGNYIQTSNLIATGMINAEERKIQKMGNTALIGAKMFLFMDLNHIRGLLSTIRHVNLESISGFQDIYVDNMLFP